MITVEQALEKVRAWNGKGMVVKQSEHGDDYAFFVSAMPWYKSEKEAANDGTGSVVCVNKETGEMSFPDFFDWSGLFDDSWTTTWDNAHWVDYAPGNA